MTAEAWNLIALGIAFAIAMIGFVVAVLVFVAGLDWWDRKKAGGWIQQSKWVDPIVKDALSGKRKP